MQPGSVVFARNEGYQETLEELGALQGYVGELQAQVVALDDLLLELLLEWECWGESRFAAGFRSVPLGKDSIYPLRGNSARNRSH